MGSALSLDLRCVYDALKVSEIDHLCLSQQPFLKKCKKQNKTKTKQKTKTNRTILGRPLGKTL